MPSDNHSVEGNYRQNWHQASRTVAWMRRQILTYTKQAALLPLVITMTLLVRYLIKCTKVNDPYGITGYAMLLVSANDLTIYLCSIRSISHNIPGSTKRADWPSIYITMLQISLPPPPPPPPPTSWTKLPPFRRWHIHLRNVKYFDSNFTEVCS